MTATSLPRLLRSVDEATRALRGSPDVVPGEVRDLVDGLDDALGAAAPHNLGVDPYLSTALFAGALLAMKAMRHDDAALERRDLRLALEQVRHALRDIVDGGWTAEEVPVLDVVRTVVEVLGASQVEVARLLGVSTRQLQRWLGGDAGPPSGRDEARVRMVAGLVNQLRHVYTSPGVPAWFDHCGPGMEATPLELLEDPVNYPGLLAAAKGARSAP